MGGQGQVRPLQGPCGSRPVRRSGRVRLLPGGGPHHTEEDGLQAPGAPRPREGSRGGDVHRVPRTGAQHVMRHRPRREDGRQGLQDLLPPRRRGAPERPELGGRDVRQPQRAQQSHRHRGQEQAPDHGRNGGGRQPRAPPREVEGLRLERHNHQRSQHQADRGGAGQGGGIQEEAHCDHHEHHQGQGGLIHGEQRRVPRQGLQPRGVREGHVRAQGVSQ